MTHPFALIYRVLRDEPQHVVSGALHALGLWKDRADIRISRLVRIERQVQYQQTRVRCERDV